MLEKIASNDDIFIIGTGLTMVRRLDEPAKHRSQRKNLRTLDARFAARRSRTRTHVSEFLRRIGAADQSFGFAQNGSPPRRIGGVKRRELARRY